jgi:hypothetical protein
VSHRGLGHSRLALCVATVILVAAACVAAPQGLDDLAGPLKTLALQASQGQMGTASASRLGLEVRGSSVQVTICYRSEAAAAATGLAQFGADVERRRDRRVQAMVPIDQLLDLAALPQVAQVEPTPKLRFMQGYGAASSQGVQLTQATSMHLAGYTGTGVKVAIIDGGFAGLTLAEVPVLPAAIVNFRADHNAVATNHGTGVAQIVQDMAPGCSMTLIAVESEQEAEDAIDYVIAQHFQVVNFSAGVTDGPFDGSHPLSVAVNRARAAGIFWVNAAGNEAQAHWQGTYSDVNSNEYLEFTGTKEYAGVDLAAGEYHAYLSWYETQPGTTDHDYDIELTDDAGNLIVSSAVTQNGDDPPKEELIAYIPAAGTYRLKIHRMFTPGPTFVPDRFQLFSDQDLETAAGIRHSENSLVIPAEATGAFAVGATRGVSTVLAGQPVVNLDRIEPFSSRGTTGSSAKPELVAPDGVTTSLTAAPILSPFMGTSAAAPHVTGAAALLLSENSGRNVSALRALLQTMALPIVPPTVPATDVNAYGAGRLRLRVGATTDGDAPTVAINFPANNTTITVSSPHVRVDCLDNTAVNPLSINVWYDATQIISAGALVPSTPTWTNPATDYDFDTSSGALTFILNNLTRTHHSLSVQCADTATPANVSLLTTSNFRITTYTISAGLHIISLPYPDLVATDPTVVFGVPLASLRLIRWVPSDSAFSKYHIYPDSFAGFAPPDALVPNLPAGLGYFLSLNLPGTLNIGAGGLTAASYDISLIYGSDAPKGWNLIGNPYETYVDWGSVEFVSSNGRQDLREAIDRTNSPVTEGILFDFVSSGSSGFYSFSSDPTQATMEPLKGYWLHVLKNATLVVYNTSGTAATKPAAKPAVAAAPSAGNWTLQLQARAGKYEDPINYIGVSSDATDGYDLGVDVSDPPPLVDSLSLYMPSASGNFAKDMHMAGRDRQEWNVEVACRLTDTPVTLSWPNLNSSVPRGVTLRLEDADSGASVYMRTSSGYAFSMTEPGVRHLRVVATTDAGGALGLTGVNATALRSGQVTFTYSVSSAADVSVEVRNISGMLIRNLGQRSAEAATAQTVVWTGQNERGLSVPSGRYLVRITARAADGQSVQSIRPFNVSR